MLFAVTRTAGKDIPPCWDRPGLEKFNWAGHPDEKWDWGPHWVIELSTIEDLVEFSRCNGQIIISEHSLISDDMPEIEIYDDWRE
jgi:hypothetical protein